MQLLIVPYYILCNTVCISSEVTPYTCSPFSVSVRQIVFHRFIREGYDSVSLCFMNRHFASISGHCFQFKTWCIPCSTAISVYHVFSIIIYAGGHKYGYYQPVYLNFHTWINGLIHTCTHISKFDSEWEVRIRILRKRVRSCIVGTHCRCTLMRTVRIVKNDYLQHCGIWK